MAGSYTAAWEGKQALCGVTASLKSHSATTAFHLPHTSPCPAGKKHYTHYRITKRTISMKNSRDLKSSQTALVGSLHWPTEVKNIKSLSLPQKMKTMDVGTQVGFISMSVTNHFHCLSSMIQTKHQILSSWRLQCLVFVQTKSTNWLSTLAVTSELATITGFVHQRALVHKCKMFRTYLGHTDNHI